MLEELAVDGFGDWLAGFIDGEGSFLIFAPRFSYGVRYRVRFKLAVRDDDADVLYEIVERTGIGEVVMRARPEEGWGDVAVWQIIRHADLVRLCEILDRFPLRARKQVDFEVFREAVAVAAKVYRGGDSLRRSANGQFWERLGELRLLLTDVRTYAFRESAAIE